jgi:hypothetical protein
MLLLRKIDLVELVKPARKWEHRTFEDHKIQVSPPPKMILLHPHKTMSKIKRMIKMKIKLMIKMKELIKREIRMMRIIKDQEQSHHTQEYIEPFKEITPLIIFLVTSRKG